MTVSEPPGRGHVSRALRLKDPLLRAALSIVLNVSEGSAKGTPKERRRMYSIALASCREVQTAIAMEAATLAALHETADRLGGHLYTLCRG